MKKLQRYYILSTSHLPMLNDLLAAQFEML